MAKPLKFDLLVVGGGTGGLRLAVNAHKMGKKVCIIEPGKIGGTCLNVGCIPTKALLQGAHLYHESKNMKEFGVNFSNVKFNFNQLMRRTNEMVTRGRNNIAAGLKQQKITWIKKPAKFIDKKTVQAGGKLYTANKILLSTGAKNIIVPIDGLDKVDVVCNENILDMKKMPKSIITIGGGYISMEFATFFNHIGCKVTVLERMPTILGMLDSDVTDLLAEYYEDRGVNVLTNVNICKVSQKGGKYGKKSVVINDVRDPTSKARTLTADAIVMAIGRAPNVDGLNLEAAGVKLGKRRNVEINQQMQTTNKNIFAIGDVTGRALFAHAAKRESYVALNNMFKSKKQRMDFNHIPWAVFVDPPIAGVGLSEKQARDKKLPVGILKTNFTKVGRAAIIGDQRGFVKVIYNKRNNRILGTVIIGPRADDMIHEFVALINSSSPTIDCLRKMIHVHPTISEVMENLEEQ